jgi:hypothetical protein
MSDLYRVTYEVTGEVKDGPAVLTSRKHLTTPEGHHVDVVNLRHTRSQGLEDDEAIRRILAIAFPFGDIEPEQVVVRSKEALGGDTLAERVRARLRDYDDTLATPGQAQDIAEADLLYDLRTICDEVEREWRP